MQRKYKLKARMAAYMKKHELSAHQFGILLAVGPSQSFLYWWANDKKNLTLDLAERFDDLEWNDE